MINSAIFLSGFGEVDFAVVSVAHTRFTPTKIAILLESMQVVMGWPLLLEHGRRPTGISTKAPCVDLKNYEAKLKEGSRKNVSSKKKLANKMCGYTMLLGQKLDTLGQKFRRATRFKRGVVNTQTALATAKALAIDHCLKRKILS